MGREISEVERYIRANVTLAPYTTFRIGGPAQFFAQPETLDDFKAVFEWAIKKKLPYFLMGGGSNLLVHDDGFRGLIIHTGKLNRTSVDGTTIRAECGVLIDSLVDLSQKYMLSGLEFAAGLPGSVGGALFMNARAYEGEFSSVVRSVHALKVEKSRVREEHLKGEELGFSYKKSIFQERKLYIYSVLFKLKRGEAPLITMKIDDIRKKRVKAGQYIFPNAGCIFKNNYDIGRPAGMIIDELGLKGKRIGGAEVYQKHANFIINRGGATARDVYDLMVYIEREVFRKTGIRLEREINLLGEWGSQKITQKII